MSIELNENTIERFVHGELALPERNAVLRQLDDQPGAWRRLALAFVEKQMLDAATQDWLRERDENVDPSATRVETATVPAAMATRGSLAAESQTNWLWTVAGLLAAVAIGYVSATMLPPGSVSPQRTIASSGEPNQAGSDDDTTMMEFEEALARCTGPAVNTLRLRLLEAGILADPTHRMRRVLLPNGDQIEMPVRGYDVRLLGASTYQ